MGDRTADGAAVTNLRVTHVPGRVSQQRSMLSEHRRLLHVHVARERTDRDVIAGVLDVRQVLHATDVDENRRLREAQLHERQEAVAASEELGIGSVLTDERDGLGGRSGADVIESCGNHGRLTSLRRP